MKDHLTILTWNEATCKAEVSKGHFTGHLLAVGVKCITLNAHFAAIKPPKKKGTNKEI